MASKRGTQEADKVVALCHPSPGPSSSYLPPAWSMAVRMEGNQEVWLLLAWNSRCSSVKKMPMHVGKPRLRPWATMEASRTTQAQQPSARSRACGILYWEHFHSLAATATSARAAWGRGRMKLPVLPWLTCHLP